MWVGFRRFPLLLLKKDHVLRAMVLLLVAQAVALGHPLLCLMVFNTLAPTATRRNHVIEFQRDLGPRNHLKFSRPSTATAGQSKGYFSTSSS